MENLMANKEKTNIFKRTQYDKQKEAYDTLKSWVKIVPKTLKDLEKKGDQDQLVKYKKQVKLVLQKLEQIKVDLENEN